MAISLSNIPSTIRVPLFYAEMDNSMANTATGEKKTVLIGQMSADGTAKVNSPTLVSSATKAMTLFGRGSQLALMVEAYRSNDASGELWCVAQKVTDGVQASGTVTVVGTALESGSVYLYVGSTLVTVTVASGATAESIATALTAKINSLGDLPITATSAKAQDSGAYVITCLAKDGGVYGNEIKLGTNLQGTVGGEENISGINVAVNGLAGGAGAVDLTTAFEALGDETYLFIGIGICDATSLDAVKTEMNDSTGRWSYAKMQYGQVFTAKRGTDSELVAFGNTRNDQHVTVFGIEESHPEPAWIVSASATGRESAYISIDPARPTQTGILYNLMSPAIENRFNMTERDTLLHNGIATLYVEGGYVRIERAITTYQLNSFGDDDNSYLDSETLFTLAEITTCLKTAITSKYARHKLANDGTRYGAGQAIVTPKVIRSELIAQYAGLEQRGLVENADLFAKYLIVERNASDPCRIDVLLPPDLVNQLRIFAMLTQFRLQYSDNAQENKLCQNDLQVPATSKQMVSS